MHVFQAAYYYIIHTALALDRDWLPELSPFQWRTDLHACKGDEMVGR